MWQSSIIGKEVSALKPISAIYYISLTEGHKVFRITNT